MDNTITIIDDIYCKASRDLWPSISRLMEYEGVRWKQGPFAKIKETKTRSFLDRRSGRFLAGFLPRVRVAMPGVRVTDRSEKGELSTPGGFEYFLEPIRSPDLPSVHKEGGESLLRAEQYELQRGIAIKAVKAQRGVIQAPTGSGKTTIAMLIASMFYTKHRILFLCHTISLLTQTREEFAKNGFEKIQTFGGPGVANNLSSPIYIKQNWKWIIKNSRIVISTVQTFSKFDPKEYCDQFDVVLVDECHHVNSVDSQFGKILTHLLAPVKIGFTATVPTDREAALALEGIIGPTIGQISIQQGVEMKIMAKPRIKLVPLPYNSVFGDIRKYQELYKAAVVDSRVRNSRISDTAIEHARAGSSSLIIVKEIQHGDNLAGIIRAKGHRCEFIQGSTEGEIREEIKRKLNDKDIKIVIATTVWKEGINIPSLNCVINAAGGKSEIATLQAIGRGLRSIPGKKEIVIVDFLDPYKYLAQHAIQRIAIYAEAGWI